MGVVRARGVLARHEVTRRSMGRGYETRVGEGGSVEEQRVKDERRQGEGARVKGQGETSGKE